MKNRYITKIGCLLLVGSILAGSPQMVMAAESVATMAEEEVPKAETVVVETEAPVTEAPTEPPATEAPVTEAPVTEAPVTEAPVTEAPVTEAPIESTTQGSETSSDTGSSEISLETGSEGTLESTTEAESETEKDDNIIKDDESITEPDADKGIVPEDHSDSYANYASNIIAGNDVYLSDLSSNYGLNFADGFEDTMDEIEADFKAFLKNPDSFIARNWQDVLAVYVMKQRAAGGSDSITLSTDCKSDLENVFFLMNLDSNSAIVRKLEKLERGAGKEEAEAESETEADEATLASQDAEYYELSVDDYIKLYGPSKSEQELLSKYTSTNCRQLCAIVSATKGFVRAEAGNVSESRVAIVAAGLSLVGKIGYFWGGKSFAIGWDPNWGSPVTVTAAGSKSSGMVRSYGLDCSGFVEWAYYNGLNGNDGGIGGHTSTQWNASVMVDSSSAQAGDMVFYKPGDAGDDNHVGLVVGVNDDGSLLVVHCSSSHNGVMTGEAWSSGFKYVRSPISLD